MSPLPHLALPAHWPLSPVTGPGGQDVRDSSLDSDSHFRGETEPPEATLGVSWVLRTVLFASGLPLFLSRVAFGDLASPVHLTCPNPSYIQCQERSEVVSLLMAS